MTLPRARFAALLFGPVLLAGLLGGCTAAPTAPAPASTRAAPGAAAADGVGFDRPERIQRARSLRVGMHKPQVLAWLGEPLDVSPASNANGQRETWIYRIVHPPVYRTVVAELEEVPYIDPLTGILRYVSEPIHNQQRIQRFETITLTLRGPRVIDLARRTEERSAFRD